MKTLLASAFLLLAAIPTHGQETQLYNLSPAQIDEVRKSVSTFYKEGGPRLDFGEMRAARVRAPDAKEAVIVVCGAAYLRQKGPQTRRMPFSGYYENGTPFKVMELGTEPMVARISDEWCARLGLGAF